MIYTLIILLFSSVNPIEKNHVEPKELNIPLELYNEIGNTSMSFEAFDIAYQGWVKLKDSLLHKSDIITLVDFSQPSTKKRFYLIDMSKRQVIYQNYVAHGKNTGMLEAQKFSNIVHSNQSSLGFFKTGETYYGKHGLSLKLDGLEKGINDKARKRHIVVHKANYAEEAFIKKYGRLGRSFGCPAIPAADYDFVIDKIKDGSLLFIYHPTESYLKNSSVLN
ncbi:murein L,D-transpeptidase catalytic domain family protein [Carboxylicivirga sp. RSCT41]|uniref:murein L,D-transpeptidase catalytic domain family protein n=1 Tax=Carboxylicivirga agarovorans TaxID=3417570 RepID=UPI003D337C6C